MSKESSTRQRQIVAQQAARMMAEEGIVDYAFAKRKAARQLGMTETQCLPGNTEIESALREYQELFLANEQPEQLRLLRTEALAVMQLLECFNPHITGAVLDGTAGRYALTDLHLFADSDKEVEIFLLNNKIPYKHEEHCGNTGHERTRIPVFVLDGEHGTIRLSVYASNDLRRLARANSGSATRKALENLLN